MFGKRDAWIISILIIVSVFSIYYFNNFSVSFAPKGGSSSSPQMKQNCITPPAYPQLITQSGTICPGVYNYGIGIGADNIGIICDKVDFKGANWVGLNGLTISGVKNISVKGCNFNSFRGDGVFVGNVTNYTAEISLLNISSKNNGENGVFVGYNVVNINLNESVIVSNNLDGIVFRANHLGQITQSSNVFPRGIYVYKNNIRNNLQNGINLDAFDYWGYISISPFVSLNNSVQIVENNISNNSKNGIQNNGFEFSYTSSYDVYTNVAENFIDENGLQLKGSGIEIIANKSDRIMKYSDYFVFPVMGFDYIISNDLKNNSIDGISLYTPKLSDNPLFPAAPSSLGIHNVFANYINYNGRHGISSTNVDNITYLAVSSYVIQNDISNNGREGIYLRGEPINYSRFFGGVECNDIISNGAFDSRNSKGIQVSDFKEWHLSVRNQNIIQGNLIGILLEKLLFSSGGSNSGSITSNYIGSNSRGLILNDTNNSVTVDYNDFDQNNLQAFDTRLNPFNGNWWSDYSPTCVDVLPGPPDGWCDFPRPIPLMNKDILPKAGNWWGHKNRGYFVRANPGVVPKETCRLITLRPSPIITVPSWNNNYSRVPPVKLPGIGDPPIIPPKDPW